MQMTLPRPLALHRFNMLAAIALIAACSGATLEGEPGITDTSGQQNAVCAVGATLEGVDVSEFQPSINWPTVKSSGRAFAIARVSDGTGRVDPTFATNWDGIKRAGMVRGVYQFFRASEDGTAQANLLLDKVGTLADGDLPPVLDVEVTDGQSHAKILSGVRDWSARIQAATGRKPILYSAPGFWNQLGAGTGFASADTLWIADWFVTCPQPANSWGSWKLWQYADNGTVPGINGKVDLDRFGGSMAELIAFASSGAGPGMNPGSTQPASQYYRGLARDATGKGYWLVGNDGGVFSFGDAQFYGSMGGHLLNAEVVAIAAGPTGKGYVLAAADGGVFAFGEVAFHGSMAGTPLNAPIVGIATTSTGLGYWLVASDGGVFAFGDAQFLGSMGGMHLNAPMVGMAATPGGLGYWLVAADGGIFAYGDAPFLGSTGSLALNAPIAGMSPTRSGAGYWLFAADGGVFAYGDAQFAGSAANLTLNRPIVGGTGAIDPGGYWLIGGDGGIFAYGDAGFFGSRG